MKPIKFEALLKNTIWGGNDINHLKQLPEGTKAVGESWEISGVPGNETIVTAGDDLGATLPALIRKYGASLVGQANFDRYGETFPLLIKFISAAQPLSIQVHPDDAMANTMGHPFGKTEMWYIIGTHEGARLCSGFAHDYSADAYAQGVEDGSIEEHLAYHTTHVGDCFFIPAGRIHSIGAGNFLVEIQQSSNDTFRVYDFDRTDANGNKRELHVAQAREALDYKAYPEYRTHYEAKDDCCTVLVDCPQFTTRRYALTKPFTSDCSDIDSFVIFIAYEGAALLRDAEGNEVALKAGEAVLFPASNASVTIEPQTPRFACLDTYCR